MAIWPSHLYSGVLLRSILDAKMIQVIIWTTVTSMKFKNQDIISKQQPFYFILTLLLIALKI